MRRFPLACLVAIATALPVSARAALLTETPTSSASQFVTRNPPGRTLQSGELVTGIDGRSSGSTVSAATKFTLATALPAGATITSATLSFAVIGAFESGGSATSFTLAISEGTSASTTVSLSDFDTADDGGQVVTLPQTFPGSSPPNLFSFDVTGLIQRDYAANSAAFLVEFDDLTTQSSVQIAESSSTEGPAPTLAIQFTPAAVPEPASAVLLGLGLVGAGCGAIRRSGRHAA